MCEIFVFDRNTVNLINVWKLIVWKTVTWMICWSMSCEGNFMMSGFGTFFLVIIVYKGTWNHIFSGKNKTDFGIDKPRMVNVI